jgi:hypothetical protein
MYWAPLSTWEAGVEAPGLDGRATDWLLKQIRDPLMENLIGGRPDRVFESFGLQELVDLRVREGGIGAEEV